MPAAIGAAPMGTWSVRSEDGGPPGLCGSETLPTLLASRNPVGGRTSYKPSKPQIEIAIPEAEEQPTQREAQPANNFRIRNTFIDVEDEESLLERISRDRVVQSCPSSHMGRLDTLFGKAAYEDFLSEESARKNEEKAAQGSQNASEAASKPIVCLFDALAGESVTATPEAVAVGRLNPHDLDDFAAEFVHQPTSHAPVPHVRAAQQPGFSSQLRPSAPEWHFPPAPLPLPPPPASLTAASHYPPVGSMMATNGVGSSVGPGLPWYGDHHSHPYRDHGHPYGNLAVAPPPSEAPGLTRFVPAVKAPAPSEPAPGSEELPSVGSASHSTGQCKPCAFLHTKGCENGAMCRFCHLCDASEKKRRQKEKRMAVKLNPDGA